MFDAARFVRETIAEFTGRAAPHAVDSALHDGPLYVMGRNPEAAALIARRRVAGIVNDFAAPGSTWNGTPEVRTEDVPRGATVVNASTSISPISARRRLEAIPEARILAYADLTRDPASDLPLPAFVAEAREAFAAHAPRWSAVRARLADVESIRIFDTLVAYRLTADIGLMEGFRVALRDQYFEPFAAPAAGAVFVDCGGFDGDTTEEFVRRHPDYARVHLFEPSAENHAAAQARLAGVRDIRFVPLGVSDTAGRLAFSSDAGSASAVSDEGSSFIDVTTLDAAVDEPVSFVKMDLEGWEIPALKGAAGHIVADRPILAIAVYHRASDFWEIPEYVLSLGVDYDLHLRHYTEGWSETVMYFVPKKG